LSLGELLWRFFGKDLGEFGNNDDVIFAKNYVVVVVTCRRGWHGGFTSQRK
jgi:hypothetical protein